MGAIRCHGHQCSDPIWPNAAFPPPNGGSDKNSVRLDHWLWRYSSLKKFKHRRTHRHTDDSSTGKL